MDDFARLMGMEGVRPLDGAKTRPRRPPATTPSRVEGPSAAPGSGVEPPGLAWVTGARARTALETALQRFLTESRDGRRGWAIGIRQNGGAVTLPASSGAAALLGTADRQALRLMIVGGDGWTFVMHPSLGVATLDEDPGEPAQ